MFLFLSLKQGQNGTIEPEFLPSSSSQMALSPAVIEYSDPRWSNSPFREYITTWDVSDRRALIRKVICVLAFSLHIPINIISIWSYGITFMMFVGMIISVLNLLGVAIALWKVWVSHGNVTLTSTKDLGLTTSGVYFLHLILLYMLGSSSLNPT